MHHRVVWSAYVVRTSRDTAIVRHFVFPPTLANYPRPAVGSVAHLSVAEHKVCPNRRGFVEFETFSRGILAHPLDWVFEWRAPHGQPTHGMHKTHSKSKWMQPIESFSSNYLSFPRSRSSWLVGLFDSPQLTYSTLFQANQSNLLIAPKNCTVLCVCGLSIIPQFVTYPSDFRYSISAPVFPLALSFHTAKHLKSTARATSKNFRKHANLNFLLFAKTPFNSVFQVLTTDRFGSFFIQQCLATQKNHSQNTQTLVHSHSDIQAQPIEFLECFAPKKTKQTRNSSFSTKDPTIVNKRLIVFVFIVDYQSQNQSQARAIQLSIVSSSVYKSSPPLYRISCDFVGQRTAP